MKILFITANRVGDAVLTTGVLAWLADHYPDARFTIACGPYGAALFRAVPRLDRLIVMRKKKANLHWVDLWKQCVGTRWDMIVDMRNSAVSRLLVAERKFFHSRGSGAHKIIDNAAVIALLLDGAPPPDPCIWLAADAAGAAETLVPAGPPVLALGPAANWPLKQWPVTSFIELVGELTAPGGAMSGARVMIVADGHERVQIEPLLRAVPDDRRIEIIGRDLQTAAACLNRARLYVGNDSGLMHLSAALGIPTLGLFGPGFPAVYGPWGKNCVCVTTPESRAELMARAPAIVTPQSTLMDTLSVARVAEAAQMLLNKTA
ncbi:MAG: glycosyltransferase family 9 protein [Alphaproteobacteria bacterium]|nr:glycosyltransferase family 9 protein [Alphaproteobacteria bacterium]